MCFPSASDDDSWNFHIFVFDGYEIVTHELPEGVATLQYVLFV